MLCLSLVAFPLTYPSPARPAEVFFSPNGGIRQHLVRTIQQSRQHIDVAVYQFTSTELAAALLEAKERGVRIRVVTDREKVEFDRSALRRLRIGGVAIRSLGVVDQSLMHNKFAVFDGRLAVTGSYNWTQSAEHANFENLVVLDDPEVIAQFEREFQRLWQEARE